MLVSHYNVNSATINLEVLPFMVRKELVDYYEFLVNKYLVVEEKKTKKEEFFATVRKQKYTLPTTYKFDRDWANER
jgi:hypothetical protein